MKYALKCTVLMTLALASTSAFANPEAAWPATAQNSASPTLELQAVTVTIANLIQFENGYIIRRPSNTGSALRIENAMSFSEAKLQQLQTAYSNHIPIRLMVRGAVVVDILPN